MAILSQLSSQLLPSVGLFRLHDGRFVDGAWVDLADPPHQIAHPLIYTQRPAGLSGGLQKAIGQTSHRPTEEGRKVGKAFRVDLRFARFFPVLHFHLLTVFGERALGEVSSVGKCGDSHFIQRIVERAALYLSTLSGKHSEGEFLFFLVQDGKANQYYLLTPEPIQIEYSSLALSSHSPTFLAQHSAQR